MIERTVQQKIQKLIKENYYQKQQYLDLYKCVDDWLTVINYGNWKKIEALNLYDCKITNENLKAVTEKLWPQLKMLWINKNEITALGIKQLIPTQWSHLQSLSLSNKCNNSCYDNIGSKGAKLLIKTGMSMLDELWLYKCKLGNEGIRHIAKGRWPKLKLINVFWNNIGLDGYTAVSEGGWQDLNELMIVSDNQQNFDGAASVLTLSSAQSKKIKVGISMESEAMKMGIISVLQEKGMMIQQ